MGSRFEIEHGEAFSSRQFKKSFDATVSMKKCSDATDAMDVFRNADALEKKFRLPSLLLSMTGLYFEKSKGQGLWYIAKLCRAYLLFFLALYQTLFILYHILSRKMYDSSTARSLVIFNWMLQSTISMGIFIYWQSRGYIGRLFQNVHCPKGCCRTVVVINETIIFSVLLYSLNLLLCLVTVTLTVTGNIDFNMFDVGLLNSFGSEKLSLLFISIHTYSCFVWTCILTFYILVGRALQHELSVFNMKLAKIGEEEPRRADKIATQLFEYYTTHVELANRIRIIDSTFEVYTFCLIGTNIPTTIFTLLNFFLALQSSRWINIVIAIPDLTFCLFELVGLTAAPAKVHSAIREVESIVYGNLRIWSPFNEKIYQVASVFIAHANQPHLGISLWGFAVVTKPLILTTISLTITYLTFLLQVQYKDDCTTNPNSTSHFSIR